MKKYAEVIDGKVTNIVVWNGTSEVAGSENFLEILEDIFVDLGFDYIDGEFVDNRPVIEEPTPPFLK